MKRNAVVQEWISSHGGSENVAEVIAGALDADVFTLWRDDPHRFDEYTVYESALARHPYLRSHKALALPLMPHAWARMDFTGYQRIVISSHLFAHHVGSSRSTRGAELFVYAHTPARYLWSPEHDHRGQAGWVRAAAAPLRVLDRKRVPRRAHFATNSNFVRKRLSSTWGVDATVIYPPVEVAAIQSGMPWADQLSSEELSVFERLPKEFVLSASRFVTYKRLDAAIDLGEDLGLEVVLAGSGPDEGRLVARASDAAVPVHFVGRPSTPLLYSLYEAASLFVFAAVEDFGIMPVEAMAAGTPVIVNEVGGASESVALIGGGVATSFDAVSERKSAAAAALSLSPDNMRQGALRLDTSTFLHRVQEWIGVQGRG